MNSWCKCMLEATESIGIFADNISYNTCSNLENEKSEKNIKNEDVIEKTDSMKKVTITSECVACGVCSTMTKYIKENSDGTASPNGAGIIPNDEVKDFQAVIDICPVKAITLEKAGLVNKSGKDGLIELKTLIQSKYTNYKISRPKPEKYKFIKSSYRVPVPSGAGERRYEYKSDSRAENAGLREFDRIMYSQRKPLIQQLLVQYKAKMLYQYTEYVEEEGMYYYDINKKIEAVLQEFIAQANSLCENKIDLSDNFAKCEFKPILGIQGDKFNKELYVYQIKHVEEIWITDNIISELESLAWFDTWVNTDYMENSRGKDMYCYELREVTEKFANQILDETANIVNAFDGMQQILEQNLTNILKEMEKGINARFQILIDAIDKAISA